MSQSDRVSKTQEVISVFAVNVAILYTWALVATMKDFSRNWILYLTISESLAETTYILTATLLESLLMLVILFAIRFLLPQKITGDRFIRYGSVISAAFLGWLMFRTTLIIGLGGAYAVIWQNSIIAAALVLIILSERIQVVRKMIESIADRCVVFLYIYLPLSLISLIVVALRNIG
jgi:hypothetical protein